MFINIHCFFKFLFIGSNILFNSMVSFLKSLFKFNILLKMKYSYDSGKIEKKLLCNLPINYLKIELIFIFIFFEDF